MQSAFDRVKRCAAGLPEVEVSTSYGTPSIKVRGKLMARMYDEEVLVVRCPLEAKDFLKQATPDVFFETDHYVGWPAILVRLANISDDDLSESLTQAWRMQAPPKLRALLDSQS